MFYQIHVIKENCESLKEPNENIQMLLDDPKSNCIVNTNINTIINSRLINKRLCLLVNDLGNLEDKIINDFSYFYLLLYEQLQNLNINLNKGFCTKILNLLKKE